MKRAWSWFLAVMLLGLLAVALRWNAQRSAIVPQGGFIRGVSLGLFATDPEWDYGPLVAEVAARGATDVLLVVNAYQQNRFAADIRRVRGNSPSLETVERTLEQVRKAGMRTALMPVVRLQERRSHEWRAIIAPADGLDAWFDAYARFVIPLAEIAQRKRATRFIVGSELTSLEPYTDHWQKLIAQVRSNYSGRLTYSANWDAMHRVKFWDALDEVGVTAYFPLHRSGDPAIPTLRELRSRWQGPLQAMAALAAKADKPLLITEVGYPSHDHAARRPWDEIGAGAPNTALQAQLLSGFCSAAFADNHVSGFYIWNWFGFGGPQDTGYSPRGKRAAATLQRCFARPFDRSRGHVASTNFIPFGSDVLPHSASAAADHSSVDNPPSPYQPARIRKRKGPKNE